MLNIALIGYGKMGKAVEEQAISRGHRISYKIDIHNHPDITRIQRENTDVAIEFTHPDSFRGNLETLLKQNIPVVSGTTGWYDHQSEIQQLVEKNEGGFMYSSNFSVGVNVLFKLNKILAELMDKYDQYDCFIEERHHRHKADAPSGTAHSLAMQVLEGLTRKTRVATDELQNRPPAEDELSVGYVRSGEIIGQHSVNYTSDIDTITISHQAHNRKGFALGAVIGAEWLAGKTGFYEFGEIV